jgi:cold-inducible RNA-binding protein
VSGPTHAAASPTGRYGAGSRRLEAGNERATAINLYVGNLPFSTTSDELGTLFGTIGEVTSAQVVTDRETGRSRGFGFVEMADEDARKAIDQLTGTMIGGRPLTVNEARPRNPRPPRNDRDRRY